MSYAVALSRSQYVRALRTFALRLPQDEDLFAAVLSAAPARFPFVDELARQRDCAADDATFEHLARLANSQCNVAFFVAGGALHVLQDESGLRCGFKVMQQAVQLLDCAETLNSTLYVQNFAQIRYLSLCRCGLKNVIIMCPLALNIDLRQNELESVQVLASAQLQTIGAEFNKRLRADGVKFFGLAADMEQRPAERPSGVHIFLSNPTFHDAVDAERIIAQLQPFTGDTQLFGRIRNACNRHENLAFYVANGAVELLLEKVTSQSAKCSFAQELGEFCMELADGAGTLFVLYWNRCQYVQCASAKSVENAVVCCPNCYRYLNFNLCSALKKLVVVQSSEIQQILLRGSDAEVVQVECENEILR